MANVRISQLPTAPDPIDGSELVPIVQNGQTVQTTVNDLISSPSLTQTFLTKVQEPSLPNSRYVGVGNGLSISDAGAQNLLQISPAGALASLVTSSTGIQVKTDATTLTNRSIATSGNGLSVSNGSGVSGDPTLSLSGLPATLANTVGTGLLAIGASTTLTPVTVTGTTNQTTVTNGNGSGGNPTIGLADNPVIPGSAAMQIPSGGTADRPASPVDGDIRYNTDTGRFEFYDAGWFNVGTGDGTISSVAGTANQIVVVNGSTAPVISIDPDPTIPGTAGMVVPVGTTAQRSGGPNGTFRYNTDTQNFEGYANGAWGAIAVGAGVTSVGTGTGLTGGPITSTGTISIANTAVTAGSYGSSTQVGTFIVNAQGQLTAASNVTITPSSIGAISAVNGTANEITTSQVGTVVTVSLPSALTFTGKTVTNGTFNMVAATVGGDTVTTNTATQTLTGKTISGASNTLTNIGNSSLTNSSVTYNGVSVALGASGTITAANPNALTVSAGLQLNSGTTYDGSAARTLSIDSTVATLTGSQTLTNKTISGASNTLTNIGNSSLTNSSVTVGTTTIALGGTSLTLAGLTSITVTQDPTAALQLATKQYVDSVAQGLDAKASCVYGTTANITLSGLGTQAGGDWASSLTAGNRILVKNQSSSQFNGIYVAASGAWTRATDMDTWAEVPSSFVFIEDGNTLADTGWVTTANAGGTIDVTPMPWVQFSGAGTYSAGTGLTLTGTAFSITNVGTAGTYGSATQTPVFTTNAQGQVTSVTNTTITPAVGSITGLGTGVATALAIAVGSAGAVVINGGALGTPSSGTLTNCTGLPAAGGGTGQSSYTIGDLLYASGATTLSKLADVATGNALISGGVGVAPSWGKIGLTTHVSGTLPVANGGTGAATLAANGVLYGSGTGALGVTAVGSTGQVLVGNTGAAPSWATVSSSLVSSFSAGTTGFTPSTATTGAVTLAGTLNATNGGTGQSTYAVGDLLVGGATNTLTKLADVATGNALISGGVGVAPSYGKIGLTTHVSGTLPIANGGTNSTATPTAGGAVYGTGTAYAITAAGTAGQVLVSQGASAPTWSGVSGGTF